MTDESDNEFDQEDFEEFFEEKGECVFIHDYEADAPGGGGVVLVYRYLGKYGCSGEGFSGEPFDLLEEALEHADLLSLSQMSSSISCEEMTAAEIAAALVHADWLIDGFELEINNEPWVYVENEEGGPGAWRRA